MPRRAVTPLNEGWTFKQVDDEKSTYLPVAQFPTNVHLDLMHHGLIPDPFIGKNELDVQWVGERVWSYRTTFSSPNVPAGSKAVIAFDGLDTFATVKVNGDVVLETDNMFIPERVDVTGKLKGEGEENELEITFDSAYLRGCELVQKYPEHKWGCWNGDVSRLAVRKAQYHWVRPTCHLCIGPKAHGYPRAGTGARRSSPAVPGGPSTSRSTTRAWPTSGSIPKSTSPRRKPR